MSNESYQTSFRDETESGDLLFVMLIKTNDTKVIFDLGVEALLHHFGYRTSSIGSAYFHFTIPVDLYKYYKKNQNDKYLVQAGTRW